MSRDPAGYFGRTNLAGYVSDRPTARVDPFGLIQRPGPIVAFPPFSVDVFRDSFRPIMGTVDIEKGCVGVAGACLGYADLYWTEQLTHCFDHYQAGLQKAQQLAARWNQETRCGKDGGKCIYHRPPKARIVFLQFSTLVYDQWGNFIKDELGGINPYRTNQRQIPRNPEDTDAFDLSSLEMWNIIKSPVAPGGANFDFAVYCGNEEGWADPCWIGANHGGSGMMIMPVAPGFGLWATILMGEVGYLNKTFYCVVCEASVNQ